jgi:hypothetical protein
MARAAREGSVMRSIAFGFCLAATATAAAAAPDLSLSLLCPIPPSEAAIENFLKMRGFEVANVERVRRQRRASVDPLDIEALDGRSRIVAFHGRLLSDLPGLPVQISYGVTVESPPPTVHDRNFEGALVEFTATKLNCQITSTDRSDTPASAAAAFRETLAAEQARLRETTTCDKTQPTYNAAECAKVPGAGP